MLRRGLIFITFVCTLCLHFVCFGAASELLEPSESSEQTYNNTQDNNSFEVLDQDKKEFDEYASSNNQIFFKFRDSNIQDEAVIRVNRLIYELSKVNDVTVILNVYADRAEGSDEYTWNLSRNRLKAIQQALIDSGLVNKNNITIEAALMSKYSLSSGDENKAGYSRRVDVFIVPK